MGVVAAPAESPPVMRGRREVCAGHDPANPNHGRCPDPILLAVAHGSSRWRPYSPEQPYLLQPSPREWLPAGHLAYFTLGLLDELDLGTAE